MYLFQREFQFSSIQNTCFIVTNLENVRIASLRFDPILENIGSFHPPEFNSDIGKKN